MNESLKFPQAIKDEIEDRIKREGWKAKPLKPLASPVMALSHAPIYRMHRYYARRPYNVFSKIIEHYSNPGDLILDPFCGGGVAVVESLKARRRVIGVDLNPLATWITQVEVESVELSLLEDAFNGWIQEIENELSSYFEAECGACKKIGIAEWFEWSNVLKCPECGEKLVLSKCEKIRGGTYRCSNKKCQAPVKAFECKKLKDQMLEVLVNCPHCGTREIRKATKDDNERATRIEKDYKDIVKQRNLKIPDDPFPDMNSVRENNLFGKGFKYFRDYFTPRQLIVIGLVKDLLKKQIDSKVFNELLHIFSASLRFTNKMVFRASGWQGGNPIEWAGHIYWPPYIYNELNPLFPLKKRFKSLVSGKKQQEEDIDKFCQFPKIVKPWEDTSKGIATCWLLTQSSHDLPQIPSGSIDVVITDPPFGGNVQYAELSDFYLVWIKEFLKIEDYDNKTFEAIETRHLGFDGAKDRDHYEDMLYKVFKECRRVIKPDGWMVLTFHNRDIGVWMAMNRAAIRAGFRLPPLEESPNRGMVYQPPIQNYTQTIHQKRTGSMLGDFILSFKPVEETIAPEPVLQTLPTEVEKEIYGKAEDIIQYHGGADETTLMTGLLPYLQEKGLLARLAKFDLRHILGGGNFVFIKAQKKWYTEEMVDNFGSLKPINFIPAEDAIQELVFQHLSENKHASIDELLSVIYTTLVNAHRPQIETIDRVLLKYCRKIKIKGQKREHYQWKTGIQSPLAVQKEKDKQLGLDTDDTITLTHNGIILRIAQKAQSQGFFVHVGSTEQNKNGTLNNLSLKLTHYDIGLPKASFNIVKQIDLIILKELTILSAIEVVTSIGTLNKAVNDRFRNLISTAPNLNLKLFVVVKDEDFIRAYREIHSPVNVKSGFAEKIQIVKLSALIDQTQRNVLPFVK